MTKVKTTIVALFAGLTGLVAATATAESILEKWPVGLVCYRGETAVVGYLATVKEDGSALYQTSGAGRAVKVTPEGLVEKTPTMSEGLSCVGRTIADLRKEGMTIDGFSSNN